MVTTAVFELVQHFNHAA